MDPCVSVVVPVCNAQADLEAQVERILDLLPEMTARFEVLIVDDGSTDDTPEIARDLATRYPQVECFRHDCRRGIDEAIRTGLEQRPGGVVMVHTPEMPLVSETLRRFVAPISHGTASAKGKPRGDLLDRLMGWEQMAPAKKPEPRAAAGSQQPPPAPHSSAGGAVAGRTAGRQANSQKNASAKRR